MMNQMSTPTSSEQDLINQSPSYVSEKNQSDYAAKNLSMKNPLIVIIGVVIIAVTGIVGMLIGQGKLFSPGWMGGEVALPLTVQTEEPIDDAVKTETAVSPTSSVAQSPLFTGKLELLTSNLSLFKITEAERQNGVIDDFTYYQAGSYATGDYAGYMRVVAIRPPEGPSDPQVAVLATKDFKTYVLDDPQGLTTKYSRDDWQNPFSFLDLQKVTKVAVLPSEFSQVLPLNESFTLFFRAIPTYYQDASQPDANGNRISRVMIKLPDAKNQLLASPFPQLKIYSSPYTQDLTYLNQLDAKQQQDLKLRAQYFTGFTTAVVVDSVGLPALYAQTTPSNLDGYTQARRKFEQDYLRYEQELERYNQDESLPYPQYPQYVMQPSLGFAGSQIKLNEANSTNKLFTDYQTAMPDACAMSQDSRIFALKDEELELVGSVGAIQLYELKDKTHPLYQLAYANKMNYFEEFPDEWSMVNKDMPRYSKAEYIAKKPLFFFKNYWQQWVGVGEFDVKLPGGCGKPVIYLYPPKPTNVSVRLEMPVEFTTEIPVYQGGWHVLAQPDGTLTDLTSRSNDCNQYDANHFGAEYAKEACQTNKYPYLYWAGSVRSVTMPKPTGGWVVANDQLEDFLSAKLTIMGLTSAEQRDFLAYWVPTIKHHQAPWYQIGFLQTSELGQLFPMTVSPQPDSMLRIFLDYTPLQRKPEKNPTPQQLERVERTGFTLIEWGGIKK